MTDKCLFDSENKIHPCTELRNARTFGNLRGSRNFGLRVDSFEDLESGEFIHEAYRVNIPGGWREIKYCPFCGEELTLKEPTP